MAIFQSKVGNLHRTARHVIPRQSGYFMSHAIELRKLGRALLLTKKEKLISCPRAIVQGNMIMTLMLVYHMLKKALDYSLLG